MPLKPAARGAGPGRCRCWIPELEAQGAGFVLEGAAQGVTVGFIGREISNTARRAFLRHGEPGGFRCLPSDPRNLGERGDDFKTVFAVHRHDERFALGGTDVSPSSKSRIVTERCIPRIQCALESWVWMVPLSRLSVCWPRKWLQNWSRRMVWLTSSGYCIQGRKGAGCRRRRRWQSRPMTETTILLTDTGLWLSQNRAQCRNQAETFRQSLLPAPHPLLASKKFATTGSSVSAPWETF